jgi:bifunctional enzyme CysN/CysC
MDLVDHSRERFEHIQAQFAEFVGKLGFRDVRFIPISALLGDNVAHRSPRMDWHTGPTLLEYLETVPIATDLNFQDWRYPVQYVLRPDLTFRGFAAAIASGVVKSGDTVLVLPSKQTSRVAAIESFDGKLDRAWAPMSVTLRLEDEIDVSRGDMLVHPDNLPKVGRRFNATLVWMSERPLDRLKSYLLKHTTQLVRAEIEHVAHTVDLESLEPTAASRLELNDIGQVTVACHRPLFYDSYRRNRSTGAFILIDSLTNNTVAAGMILDDEPAPPAESEARGRFEWPHTHVSPAERNERLGQKGAAVWLTGLPASGKSAIAYALERRLFDSGRVAMVIDPDDGLSREGLPDGSSPAQTPELARRCADAGLFGIFAYASPLRADREALRAAVGDERFVEVHVATSKETCKKRDARGAYGPAHPDPQYERPQDPAVTVSLDSTDADEAAYEIMKALERCGLLPSQYAL